MLLLSCSFVPPPKKKKSFYKKHLCGGIKCGRKNLFLQSFPVCQFSIKVSGLNLEHTICSEFISNKGRKKGKKQTSDYPSENKNIIKYIK